MYHVRASNARSYCKNFLEFPLGEGYGLGFNNFYDNRPRRVHAMESELNVLRVAHVSHLPGQMILAKMLYNVQTAPKGEECYKSIMRE